MNRDDLVLTYLSISGIKGISPKVLINIVKRLGTLANVTKIDSKFLKEAGLTDNQISEIKKGKSDVDPEFTLIKKHNIEMILYEDEKYPQILKEITDPPAFLYAYGNLDVLLKPSLAIVGSRKASVNAVRFTRKLASDLAEVGFNIISGFASGIDTSAHLGAIEKGTTTAVFGNGLLIVYPSTNKKYLKQICEKGCIVSELPLKEQPNFYNFPRRNRIISGLCHGVIVVEAYEKSGSLITARLALEYGRDLFAVPTWPENHNTGTNKLIKEGAKLVENYLDVLSEYPQLFETAKRIDKRNNDTIINVDSNSQKILELLQEFPCSVDEICIKTGFPVSDVLALITELELEDWVTLNNEGKYTINRR